MKKSIDDLSNDLRKEHGALLVRLRRHARSAPWDGRRPIRSACRALLPSPIDRDRLLSVLLTLDYGAHSSGWWKNSEYEYCYHLSIVAFGPHGEMDAPKDAELRSLATAIFGDDVRKCWLEPPASTFDTYRIAPQSHYCWHVRLFIDRQTRQPIMPVGEVYTLKPWADGSSPEKVYR